METERRAVNDSSMDGDIEDADCIDTERRGKQPSLVNKISASAEQNSMDSDYFKKKNSGNKHFPLT